MIDSSYSLYVIPDTILINREDPLISNSEDESFYSKKEYIKDTKSADILRYIYTILAVVIGFVLNRSYEIITKKSTTKKNGKRWINEIKALEEPIRNQIKNLEKVKEEHNDRSYSRPNIVVSTWLSCEGFKSLDKNDLYNYIEQKYKNDPDQIIKVSNTTNGYISVLANLHETLKLKHSDYISGTSTHIEALSVGLQELLSEFNRFSVFLEADLDDNPAERIPAFRQILDLMTAHLFPKMEDGSYNPFDLERHFLFPLLAPLADMRHIPGALDLSKAVSSCLHSIKAIQMENKYILDSAEMLRSRYEVELNELSKIVLNLEKNN